MARFAAYSYNNTNNLGDEIQTLAAVDLLPHVDLFIDRDDINASCLDDDLQTNFLANGWYCQYPERWHPRPQLKPLLLSMHFSREIVDSKRLLRPVDHFRTEPMIRYLREHGPVGSRDLATFEYLSELGVPSYFSGCLTLTLGRPDVHRAQDLVVLNDLPLEVLPAIRQRTRKSIFSISHVDFENQSVRGRLRRAREVLAMYARASCVVTSRLHCALPCLAMGTPVLLIDVASDSYRFSGLRDLLRACTIEQFLDDERIYNLDDPMPNKQAHLYYAAELKRRVRKFVLEAGEAASESHQSDRTGEQRPQQDFDILAQREVTIPIK